MVYYNSSGFSGYMLKPSRDEDLYVRWSSVCDGFDPEDVGTEKEFLAAGCPAPRLQRAAEFGSSDAHEVEKYGRFGGWDYDGFIVNHRAPERNGDEEVFFWLPRSRFLEYAKRMQARDFSEAAALLEKRDIESEEIVG